MMVSTGDGNRTFFASQKVGINGAKRRLQVITERLSYRQMPELGADRQRRSCTTTQEGTMRDRKIFVSEHRSLKDKTARRRGSHAEPLLRAIPSLTMERHSEVIQFFDVTFLNEIAFLVSIFRGIRFFNAVMLKDRSNTRLLA